MKKLIRCLTVAHLLVGFCTWHRYFFHQALTVHINLTLFYRPPCIVVSSFILWDPGESTLLIVIVLLWNIFVLMSPVIYHLLFWPKLALYLVTFEQCA